MNEEVFARRLRQRKRGSRAQKLVFSRHDWQISQVVNPGRAGSLVVRSPNPIGKIVERLAFAIQG